MFAHMFEERDDSSGASARPWGSYAEDVSAGPGWGAALGDTSVPVSPEIAALEKAIAAVAAIDPRQLDPAQALADTSGLVAMMQQLKVATLSRVADVEERKLHRLDGAPTLNSWLRQSESGLTSADVTLARRLPTLPTSPRPSARARSTPQPRNGSPPRWSSSAAGSTGLMG